MRRTWRWLKRLVIGGVALAILSVALFVAVLHTSWGRNRVRQEIVAELQVDFPGSTIGSLEGSPFGTIVLRDVTILSRDGKPLVTASEIRVSPALRPLVRRVVRLDSIAVRGVHVFARPQPPLTDTGPMRWSIELPDVTVDDAQVSIDTATGTETIADIALRAAVDMPVGEPFAATVNARGTWRGKVLTASALAAVGDTVHLPFVSVSLDSARIVGTNLAIAGDQLAGTLRVTLPPALASELAAFELPPDLGLPPELDVVARARDGAVIIAARAGTVRADATIAIDLRTLRARGLIEAAAPELGLEHAVVAVDATLDGARGIAVVRGHHADAAGSGTVAFHLTPAALDVVAVGSGERGTLRASGIVTARGPLDPSPRLAVSASIDARGYRDLDTSVAAARVTVSGTLTPGSQQLEGELTATDIRSGATRIPSATLAGSVTRTGETLTAELGGHRVVGPDRATWTGRGGRVTVTPDAIVVTDVRTSTRGSELVATGRIGRLDDALAVTARARNVSLALLDPTLGGSADADINVKRSRGAWRGSARVRAHGVALPGRPVVDADVAVTLAGRKVAVDASIATAQAGSAQVSVALSGPRDIADVAAWRALPRASVDKLELAVRGLDLAAFGASGQLDGEVALGPTTTRGELHLRGVATPAGPVDAELAFTPGDRASIVLAATVRARDLAGASPATADAEIVLPTRPFDPHAWKTLGRGALRTATFRTGHQRIDPALLARFGVIAPYSADVEATVTVGAAGHDATIAVDVRGLRGGRLSSGVDVVVRATTDNAGTRGTIEARSGILTTTVTAETPLTVEGALAGGALTAPIEATATIPQIAARDLLALLGETDVVAGRIGGTATFRGSLAAPKVRAQLAAHGLALRPRLAGREPPKLDSLTLDATWEPAEFTLELIGHEGPGRLLKIAARGNPADPHSVVASIEAANFDIAPLVAFAPGAARAARGTLNAALKIRGLDPQTGSIRGKLAIRDGRFPLSPELGTLRRASLDVDIVGKQLIATFDGRLGAGGGNASGTLTAEISGGMPMSAHLEMKLRKVSPIGALQPIVDADLIGNWTNHGEQWRGGLQIRNGNIVVPPETGNDLLVTGAPSDMIFIDRARPRKRGRRVPTKPWLVTTITIGDTNIDVQDAEFRVRITARGKLEVAVGDGIGVTGLITTTRGSLELLGRRYRVENATIDFVGTTNPRLDIRIVRDFKTMTLTVDVFGTAEVPDVRLSSDPGIYTQGQLMSFLAGAEPGYDDSTAQANQAVASAGLSILSGRVGRRVNKHLPFKFDSINYEAGTSASSQAVRFGVQLSEKSYLIWRQRLAARPDENPGEAVFEYQFRKNLLFEGTIGERAKGGDFLWRKRW